MGFFNNIGKKTSETTNRIAKETKLKLKINDNKGKINDIYEQIGKKVYQQHIREEKMDIKKELEEDCGKIDEISQEIEEARKEILFLANKKMCQNCSAQIEIDAQFCQKCGAKQETIEQTVKVETEDLEASENKE